MKRPKRPNAKKKIDYDARLWRVFSEFIRLRDANSKGYCTCSTCGKIIYWSGGGCDAGHFISRDNKNTKFDENNVHSQCVRCNRFKGGRQFEMSIYIKNKYGTGVPEKILQKSKFPKRFNDFELMAMIQFYKGEVLKLKKLKNL